MAKDQELGIRVRVKGSGAAKRDLKGLIGEVRKGVRGGPGGPGAAPGVTGGREERPSSAAAARGGPSLKNIFLGNLLAQAATRSFSALSAGVAQSYDPNLSDIEKRARFQSGLLGGIPVVGESLAAKYQAQNAVTLGTVQGTQQRLNQTFGAAFQAIGAGLGPGASEADVADAIDKKLGPAIERLATLFEKEEAAQEIGSQYIAKQVGKGGSLEDLDVAAAMKEGIEFALPAIGSTIKAIFASPEVRQAIAEAISQAISGAFGGSGGDVT